MARQDQEKVRKVRERKEPEAAPAPNPEVVEKGKRLKKDLDQLLEEIDEVLEENAEEFVKSFVQKGGE